MFGSMALFLIVKGFQNKCCVRDILINAECLEKMDYSNFKIAELVFNHDALMIGNMWKGAYIVKMNNVVDRRTLQTLLEEELCNDSDEEDYKFAKVDDEEYQNLFLGWQGFMF